MAGSLAVYEDEFVVPRSAVSEDITLASFDKGCSLTKALIGYRENATVRFKCLTFNNTDFDDAMAWMRSQITFGTDPVVRVTGAGGDVLQEEIAKALDCKTKWVDEMGCQCKGIDFLLKHASDADIFYPEPKRQYTFNADNMGETWTEMQERMLAEHGNRSENETYPTIFTFFGSGTGTALITKDDGGRIVNGGLVCGRSLLALSNLLLGTSDFQELNELAMKGDRSKVDILAKEMFAETSSPLYLALPGEMSIFPLGKLSDDHAKEKAAREDKASGLLTLFVEILAPLIFSDAIKYQASQIVLGGNLVRSQYFREAYASGDLRQGQIKNLKVKYLKTGHTGAIGALVFDS